MIVYFFKKSKDTRQIILGGMFLLGALMYVLYVVKMRALHDRSTIQVIRIEQGAYLQNTLLEAVEDTDSLKAETSFVSSKKGVYYYPINCSKAQALSVKNMLYFKDKMSAERAGYKPYNGCF